jgi:predicted SnoaL-like aldol condensation-catalyzing enzyme
LILKAVDCREHEKLSITALYTEYINYVGEAMMNRTIASEQKKTERRNIVTEYFNLLAAGKYKDVLRFFTPDCKTHNPYISGNMEALTDAMIAANNDMKAQSSDIGFSVKHLIIEGDLVAAHTQLLYSKSNPGKGGLRQAHIFRFEGNKIAEYWDITQEVLESVPNAAGSF